MKNVTIKRKTHLPWGTYGILKVGDFICMTVERPWLENKPYVSCIPAGAYELKPDMYYGGDGIGGKPDYPAYTIVGVPNRSLIKIHVANAPMELNGCIGLGDGPGFAKGQWAVKNSKSTFAGFMKAMNGEAGKLDIYWDC